MWTTPFLLVASAYLTFDCPDIAEVAHEFVDHDGDMDCVERRAGGEGAGDGAINGLDLVDGDGSITDPLASQLLAEVTGETDLVEPVEHPADDAFDIVMADLGRHLEGQCFGHRLDGIVDPQLGGRDGVFEFASDSADGNEGAGDDNE